MSFNFQLKALKDMQEEWNKWFLISVRNVRTPRLSLTSNMCAHIYSEISDSMYEHTHIDTKCSWKEIYFSVVNHGMYPFFRLTIDQLQYKNLAQNKEFEREKKQTQTNTHNIHIEINMKYISFYGSFEYTYTKAI